MIAYACAVVALALNVRFARAWGHKAPPPTIATRSGGVAGTVEQNDPPVDAFKGIPFAQPPLGDLRWRAPRQERAWNGTRLATTFGHACVQPPNSFTNLWPHGISEDCLTLNVYRPHNNATRKHAAGSAAEPSPPPQDYERQKAIEFHYVIRFIV